ncbi:DUF4176 domain-containing protein [Floricoccus tropicus]|uniref:DUF4176 domain-containing protein n=1 Tax=Floricoccus tropicus TaxID=1859473 RepID=UPI000C0205C6|nr:DUF4176 domain-containing protein [Floricoccus tropicus]
MISIGSIVTLKEGTKKIMILNRGVVTEIKFEKNPILFDYSGTVYPFGLNPKNILCSNEENIDEVIFEGYFDEEERNFVKYTKIGE